MHNKKDTTRYIYVQILLTMKELSLIQKNRRIKILLMDELKEIKKYKQILVNFNFSLLKKPFKRILRSIISNFLEHSIF